MHFVESFLYDEQKLWKIVAQPPFDHLPLVQFRSMRQQFRQFAGKRRIFFDIEPMLR